MFYKKVSYSLTNNVINLFLEIIPIGMLYDLLSNSCDIVCT